MGRKKKADLSDVSITVGSLKTEKPVFQPIAKPRIPKKKSSPIIQNNLF